MRRPCSLPQKGNEALICEYTNLLYACTRCNSARRNVLALDPTREAFGKHCRVRKNGVIEGVTKEGQALIDLLHLNDVPALPTRRKYLEVLALKKKVPDNAIVDRIYTRDFGFPEDLPDLRRTKPPGGNKATGSELECYFAKLERNEIPRVY